MYRTVASSTLRGFLFLSITYTRFAYKSNTYAAHPEHLKPPKSAAPSHFCAHFPPLRFTSSQKTEVKWRFRVVSSHPRPLIRNLLQITSQKQGVKGRLLVATSQKQGGNEWLKNIRPPTFFQTLKTDKTRQDAALPHFLPEKIDAICFLLNKGSRSLASLTPQTQKPKGKGGASNAPGRNCRSWHSHHLTNPPGTTGGQQPEITTKGR